MGGNGGLFLAGLTTLAGNGLSVEVFFAVDNASVAAYTRAMVETMHNPPANREPYTVEYAYDHQGRMVRKQVSANAVVLSTRSLVWDNWNIIAETIHSAVPSFQSSTNLYVWGLDIAEQSGAGLPRHSAPGASAGGVGGLLAEVRDGVFYTAAYDANGNVTEYADDSGNIAAHYEYSPFGNSVVQSGPMAGSFTHRFSTKPFDAETGLVMYQLRPYEPDLGRWASRDPIAGSIVAGTEAMNICLFVRNNSVDNIDPLGLWSFPAISLDVSSGYSGQICVPIGGTWGLVIMANVQVKTGPCYGSGGLTSYTSWAGSFGASLYCGVCNSAHAPAGMVTGTLQCDCPEEDPGSWSGSFDVSGNLLTATYSVSWSPSSGWSVAAGTDFSRATSSMVTIGGSLTYMKTTVP